MSTFNFLNVFDLWSEENWKNNKFSALAVLGYESEIIGRIIEHSFIVWTIFRLKVNRFQNLKNVVSMFSSLLTVLWK